MRGKQLAGAALLTMGALLAGGFPVVAAANSAHAASLTTVLADPTLAFALLLVALLGVGIEILHPGAILPGSIGVAAGVLAVVGLANLPVNVIGLVLVGLAAVLLVVDTAGQSHGVLSLLGVALVVAAGTMLFRGSGNAVNVAGLVAVPVAVGGTWAWISRRAIRVRRIPFGSSNHELLGLVGVVRERGTTVGKASVGGELWRVTSRDGEALEVGDSVEVLARDGLTLIVDRVGTAAPPEVSRAASPGRTDSASG
ncbi:MAG: NfeD family protein [Candidatus Dormibacteria bacterium]